MTTHTQTCCAAPARPQGPSRKRSVLGAIFAFHGLWVERRRLARLDAHRLDDLGLTMDEAKDEARRQMWDAPDRWRR